MNSNLFFDFLFNQSSNPKEKQQTLEYKRLTCANVWNDWNNESVIRKVSDWFSSDRLIILVMLNILLSPLWIRFVVDKCWSVFGPQSSSVYCQRKKKEITELRTVAAFRSSIIVYNHIMDLNWSQMLVVDQRGSVTAGKRPPRHISNTSKTKSCSRRPSGRVQAGLQTGRGSVKDKPLG